MQHFAGGVASLSWQDLLHISAVEDLAEVNASRMLHCSLLQCSAEMDFVRMKIVLPTPSQKCAWNFWEGYNLGAQIEKVDTRAVFIISLL
eukprot:5078953-Amphidinium_carterae.1